MKRVSSIGLLFVVLLLLFLSSSLSAQSAAPAKTGAGEAQAARDPQKLFQAGEAALHADKLDEAEHETPAGAGDQPRRGRGLRQSRRDSYASQSVVAGSCNAAQGRETRTGHGGNPAEHRAGLLSPKKLPGGDRTLRVGCAANAEVLSGEIPPRLLLLF
jgi:hypothetical protein